MVIIVSIDMGRVGMGRVGIVLDLVAEFVMGRLCQGPSLLWAEFVMGRDVPESNEPQLVRGKIMIKRK